MAATFGIARSGVTAAGVELAVSANNVANAQTDGFVPSRAEPVEQPEGGVAVNVQKEPAPPADPLAEVRADRALLAPSRTDLVQELPSQSRAAAVYRANLATLRTAEELEREVTKLKE
jgi:flagellar basal-body rod protein FlgC